MSDPILRRRGLLLMASLCLPGSAGQARGCFFLHRHGGVMVGRRPP